MSHAEYIRSVLLTCPFIDPDSPDMRIDFLGADATQYSIESIPTQPIIRRYMNGDSMRRYSFALVARFLTIDDMDRSKCNEEFERLSLWLEQQTRARVLPPMGSVATPRSIEATGGQYVSERASDGDTALYYMQNELIYIQTA